MTLATAQSCLLALPALPVNSKLEALLGSPVEDTGLLDDLVTQAHSKGVKNTTVETVCPKSTCHENETDLPADW